MKSRCDSPTLLSVLTIGVFLVVFGVLGIASLIYKRIIGNEKIAQT